MLTELKNRGVEDCCIVVCDGLRGPPDAIASTWPLALVQTCVLHLVRNTFRRPGPRVRLHTGRVGARFRCKPYSRMRAPLSWHSSASVVA